MKKLILTLFTAILFFSCANDPDSAADKAFFTRIYDNNKFNVSYLPLDIKQTSDDGYLVLGIRRLQKSFEEPGSAEDLKGIYLMKTDALGDFVSDEEMDEGFVNPTSQILQVDDKLYFFCMATVGLQTQLVEISEDGKVVQTTPVGGSYPAAAGVDGSNLLLLNYDIAGKNSVISRVSTSGTISASKSFSIGAGDAVEEPIINHFLRTGRQIPFQVGKAGNLYYFNGFINYSLSLVFTDLNADNPIGVINGQQENGGMSYVVPLTGSKFATARFNFGDNYLLPSVSLNSTGISSWANLGGNYLPELEANAPVFILQTTIGGKDALLYGSSTKSGQIVLLGYDPADGTFLGTRYLGFSNAFEMASMCITSDKGVAIVGTTYLAGRFPRICIFRLSPTELSESFKF